MKHETNPFAPPPSTESAGISRPDPSERSVSGKGLELARPLVNFAWEQYKKSAGSPNELAFLSVAESSHEQTKRGWVRRTKEDVPVLAIHSYAPNALEVFEKHETALAALSPGNVKSEEGSTSPEHEYAWQSIDLDSEGLKPPHINHREFSEKIQHIYDDMKPHLDEFRKIVERNKEQIDQKNPGLALPGDPFCLEGKIDLVDRHMSALTQAVKPEMRFTNAVQGSHIIRGDTLADQLTAANAMIPYNMQNGYNNHVSAEDTKALRGHMNALVEIINANQADLDIAAHHALYQQAEHGINTGRGIQNS